MNDYPRFPINIDYYKKLAKMESTFAKGGVNEVLPKVLYHYTNDKKPVISTHKDRLVPNSLSTSANKEDWSNYGKNLFEITLPENAKLMIIDKNNFFKYGKEVDTPLNRGKEIYKEAKKNKIDVIFFKKVVQGKNEYVVLNKDFKYKKVNKNEKRGSGSGVFFTLYKEGGEIDADNPKIKNEMIHKSGKVGGLLVGKRHSEGGIKAINKSNNSPLEMEGGEVVITRNAVSDDTKREFEGEMLTNREILSRINEGGGGVSFAKGGDVPEHIMVSGKEYKYGGKTLKDSEIVDYCGCKHKMAEGGTTESSVFRGYEIGDDGTYRKPNTKNFGIKYPELKPSEAFAKIYGNKYKNGGKVESIMIIDKSVPSYNDFKNNNKNINLHITKSEYKKYLNNNYKVDFDHLPNTIRMGLLLGNQKLVDKYINA
jgi:hypothetical protein